MNGRDTAERDRAGRDTAERDRAGRDTAERDRAGGKVRTRVLGGLAVVALLSVAFVAVDTVSIGGVLDRLTGSDGPRRADQAPALPDFVPGPIVGYNPASVIDDAEFGFMVDEVIVAQPGERHTVRLLVDATPGVEVQFAWSPSFVGRTWEPAQPVMELATTSTGYQELYGRMRLPDGRVGEATVVGVSIDPTEQAAVASAADGGVHRPSWVRPLSSSELVVRVETGRLRRGHLEPYDLDNPPDGDEVIQIGSLKMVDRDGEPYGIQVSARTDVIRRVDRFEGTSLDVDTVLAGQWSLAPTGGSSAEVAVVSADVVSRPYGGGTGADGVPLWGLSHDIRLRLDDALAWGSTYRLDSATGLIAPTTFTLDPTSTVSPTVQTNQVGFAPGDRSKLAYVGGWVGEQPPVSPGADFEVVTAFDAQPTVAFTGTLVSPDVGTAGAVVGHGADTPVLLAQFGGLSDPGWYRVCVAEVGCSYPFEVGEGVWADLAATVAKASYYQRSGVALGLPYASFSRPRPYHPDDGFVVNASGFGLGDVSAAPNHGFAEIVAEGTDTPVPEAWGGHFDAGDWDRRIQHLWLVRAAAELVTQFPDTIGQLELAIPESSDRVPDVLDEALWSLDLYYRMQGDDGSIRGGIEASEHPPPQSTSWVDDLAVYALAPDPFSAYIYAGAAAEAARALTPYDEDRAGGYEASALAAFEWAEQAEGGGLAAVGADGPIDPGAPQADVAGNRLVALAALYRLTGDPVFHDGFVEAADRRGLATVEATERPASCHAHVDCDALWLYLRTSSEPNRPEIDRVLVDHFERYLLASADEVLWFAGTNGYRWTSENAHVPQIWGLGAGGSPRGVVLARAYLLTGDPAYRDGLVDSAGVSLGANPLNRSLLTGRGVEPPVHPQINDIKHGGLPVWPGVPVYGFHDLSYSVDDDWAVNLMAPAGPRPTDPSSLPYLWQWFDVDMMAFFNEFTVHQSSADSLYAYGVLAG